MTTPTRHDLDPFQTRLLAELRDVVAERATRPGTEPGAPGVRQRRRRPSPIAVAAGLAVPTLAATAALLTLDGGSPAYAVIPQADGAVSVTVSRLEDAEALEQALSREGVRADVSYTRPGMLCAPGRYAQAPFPPGSMSVGTDQSGGMTFVVPAGLTDDATTLVIESSWDSADDDATWSLGVGLADGAVGACEEQPVAEVLDAAPAAAPEELREDTPEFTGPLAQDLAAVWQTTTTDRQREILADGVVTEAENAELQEAFTRCMADEGYEVEWQEGGGFAVFSPEQSDPQATVHGCELATTGRVTSLYHQSAESHVTVGED